MSNIEERLDKIEARLKHLEKGLTLSRRVMKALKESMEINERLSRQLEDCMAPTITPSGAEPDAFS